MNTVFRFLKKSASCLLSFMSNAERRGSPFFLFPTDASSHQSRGQAPESVSPRAPSPPPPSTGPPAEPSSAPPAEHLRPVSETPRPKDTPLPLPCADKNRGSELIPSKKPSSLLNSVRPPAHPKDGAGSLNGRTKTWESFTAEEFAQQFHESVLQSTQKALQKHKGG